MERLQRVQQRRHHPPTGGGLTVHQGGDYRVASAYLSRGEGAVRDLDGQRYDDAPPRNADGYRRYYARHIEWFVACPDLSDLDEIKIRLMTDGVVATSICYDSQFLTGTAHYQPPGNDLPPNHAVAIIGWDDTRVTGAPEPGAWLCKNSWGAWWGESGYFWVSYWDRCCCQDPEMGAISLRDVVPLPYDRIYYHDYHGWRDTLRSANEAFNAFTATGHEVLAGVSFFTAEANVAYDVRVYDTFSGGELSDVLAVAGGTFEHPGMHTVDLPTPVELAVGEDFCIYLDLSTGGQPYDRTSDVPVLLGGSYRTIVHSQAAPGESYYRVEGTWVDLQDCDEGEWPGTGNFCIKGLAVDYHALRVLLPDGLPTCLEPGVETPITVQIVDEREQYVPGSGRLYVRYYGDAFVELRLTPLGGDLYQAILPAANCNAAPAFYVAADGDGGSTVTCPADAPASAFTAVVGTFVPAFADDFEMDMGWTVIANAIDGNWERGDPEQTVNEGYILQPADDHSPTGTQCYVTGPLAGGGAGAHDLDGGPTRLVSPLVDLAGTDALVSYWSWYQMGIYWDDVWLVEITNDDGANWVPIEAVTRPQQWTRSAWWVGDYITPTAQMRVRFTANDTNTASMLEALVDDFRVETLTCTPAFPAGDVNCDGALDNFDIAPFVLAVIDPPGYQADYPLCDPQLADVNGDGATNNFDIAPFVHLLTGG
ncbi:MAG: lectin like domain-containing protein [Phycisphaerae bacterium]